MKIALPILLLFVTSIMVFFYDLFVRKYQSLFLPAIFNTICFGGIAIFAYFYEKQCIPKLKLAIYEPYLIPYLILNISATCLWFFITKSNGAAYAGIFKSAYIIPFILMSIIISGNKIDLQFLIGTVIAIIGLIIIQFKK